MPVIARVLREALAQRRLPPHLVAYARQRAAEIKRGLRRRARHARGVRRRLVLQRALPAAGGPAGTPPAHVEQVDGAWQAATDLRFASVRAVAEDNLAAVARLLDAAGVRWFVRDAAAPGPIVVGVDDIARRRVWEALAAAASDSYLYARALPGRGATPLWHSARVTGALARADRVLVYRNHRAGPGYVLGAEHGCVVEFWRRAGHNLRPPPGAAPGRFVPAETAPAEVTVGGRRYPTLSVFADHSALAAPDVPVDVVYTWVDDRDPAWRARLRAERERAGRPLHPQAANASRYRNRDELRYSLRALALYAGFVRRVFVVTAGQVPSWLDVDHPDITIVDHEQILDAVHLPTFNSHAIEARLHRIDGLSEQYLYLNDDFVLGREVGAATFFTANGLARFFPDPEAPIPAGPAADDDRPVDSASKNVRDLLRTHLGVRVGRKMLHAPYPQLRSVLFEMEKRFPDEFARTVASRFRSPTDLNVASCFAPYYAFATGRAVPGELSAEYVNIASRWAGLQMRRLLECRDRDAFCLNETDLRAERRAAVDAAVDEFLSAYLPVASPWERAERR